MANLLERKREPEWKDVLGVQVLFAPVSIKADRESGVVFASILGDQELEGVERNLVFAEAIEERCRIILRHGIMAWRLNADDAIREPDAERVESWLDDPDIYPALRDVYAMPFVMRDIEKNASAGSQGSIGTKATPAPDTASSPVPSGKTAAAKGAASAVTAPRTRRRTKARPSGS